MTSIGCALGERRAMGMSGLRTEVENLRHLLLVLATDHVAFFQVRRKKRATVDNHVLARLLYDYQRAIKAGHTVSGARTRAKQKLPGKLAEAADRRIQNLLSKSRKRFAKVIDIKPDGSIVPRGPLEARLWRFDLMGARDEIEGVIEPSPDDPDAVIVHPSRAGSITE